MSQWLQFLLTVLVAWGAWIGLLRWMQKGRFEVLEDSPTRFVFRSNCGEFMLHRQTGTLAWKQDGRNVSTTLEQIKGVDYLANEGSALVHELMNGFDLTDLFSRYRDTIEHHQIALITERYGRVPVFYGSRWQRREFLMGWLIDLQDGILMRTGLIRDVEQQARWALDLLQSRLGKERATR